MANHRHGSRLLQVSPEGGNKPPQIMAQHNHLLDSCYSMSLDEKRLVMLAMTKITFVNHHPWGIIEVDFTVDEWKNIYPRSHTNAYSVIKKACHELMNRQVRIRAKEKINKENGQKERTIEEIFNWVDSCRYIPSEGRIRLKFGATCSIYLDSLNKANGNFTLCDLQKLAPLTTFYSIRLYELLQKRRDKGTVYRTVEDLRQILEIEDKYPKFSALQKRVLDPAVKDINKQTGIGLVYSVLYKNRIAQTITFQFQSNE